MIGIKTPNNVLASVGQYIAVSRMFDSGVDSDQGL